jgi:hypothetical protein
VRGPPPAIPPDASHKEGPPVLIVSLTSIPSRFHLLGATLRSILAQDVPIDAVELWIPRAYRRFPQHVFCLPEVPEGVRVRVTEADLGPATKVLPAAAAHRGTDARILYCDDDRIVHRSWARSFLTVAKRVPDCAVAISGWDIDFLGFPPRAGKPLPRARRKRSLFDLSYRWRRLEQKYLEVKLGRRLPKPDGADHLTRAGYVDIMEGCGGVLVRPAMFDAEAFDIPDKLWPVDDIWLSGMLARRGIRIWSMRRGPMPQEQDNVADPLYRSVIEGLNRHQANCACVRHLQDRFGIWQDTRPPAWQAQGAARISIPNRSRGSSGSASRSRLR